MYLSPNADCTASIRLFAMNFKRSSSTLNIVIATPMIWSTVMSLLQLKYDLTSVFVAGLCAASRWRSAVVFCTMLGVSSSSTCRMEEMKSWTGALGLASSIVSVSAGAVLQIMLTAKRVALLLLVRSRIGMEAQARRWEI